MYNFEIIDPTFLPHTGCSLSLPLEKGEEIVIVGPNGVGKSTLAHRIQDKYQKQTDIVLIEQKNLEFFYDRKLTTFKKIIFSVTDKKLNKSFFDYCWESFGLKGKENRLLSELSGGEKQALKLCCGLAAEAWVYLLDEPAQSLDVQKKKILSGLITKLTQDQKSVVIIEHDLSWITAGRKVYPLTVIDGVLQKDKTCII